VGSTNLPASLGKPAPAHGRGAAGYRPGMTKDEFSKGDHVTWKSHGGEAEGEVVEKITSDTREAGRQVRASTDDPQYLVRSDKSGGEAVHRPGALEKED
jgi:hypothetical protein